MDIVFISLPGLADLASNGGEGEGEEEDEGGGREEGRELEVNTGSSTCKGIWDVHVLVGMNMCAASSHLSMAVHCGHVSTHL